MHLPAVGNGSMTWAYISISKPLDFIRLTTYVYKVMTFQTQDDVQKIQFLWSKTTDQNIRAVLFSVYTIWFSETVTTLNTTHIFFRKSPAQNLLSCTSMCTVCHFLTCAVYHFVSFWANPNLILQLLSVKKRVWIWINDMYPQAELADVFTSRSEWGEKAVTSNIFNAAQSNIGLYIDSWLIIAWNSG